VELRKHKERPAGAEAPDRVAQPRDKEVDPEKAKNSGFRIYEYKL
jgi:hypothetical protein